MNAGWIGGIVGSLVGIAAGVLGTYCGIKNTQGPRERAFMVKCAIICWAYVLGYLLLLITVPRPYGWFLSIPYALLLCVGIVYANPIQQRIRQEESRNQPSSDPRS